MAEDGAMPQPKKYRLDNTEYELVTTYLGWLPEGFADWEDFISKDVIPLQEKEPRLITLASPDKKVSARLVFDHYLMKEALPLTFFGEERARNWWRFYKVATKEQPYKQFIIPLH